MRKIFCGDGACLVAPYCAIPRDYLSDTPLLRAMGFLTSQHGQLGAIPPPPIPYENKANGRHTPLCDAISKGHCKRYGGGVSRTGPLRVRGSRSPIFSRKVKPSCIHLKDAPSVQNHSGNTVRAETISGDLFRSGVAPANQTKESQFMNFSQGHSGTKAQCELCLFSQGKKHQNSHKNGRNS